MSPLLAARGLDLAYGEAAVCRGLCFEIAEGEIVALLGANGAGKSTTLRAVAGALMPRAGSITFRGQEITRLPSHARNHLGIALVPEGRHVFPYLTVRENLELGGFQHREARELVHEFRQISHCNAILQVRTSTRFGKPVRRLRPCRHRPESPSQPSRPGH